MKSPERSEAYRKGDFSRRMGKGREANPYPLFRRRVEHYYWLAGWHDRDMELKPKSEEP